MPPSKLSLARSYIHGFQTFRLYSTSTRSELPTEHPSLTMPPMTVVIGAICAAEGAVVMAADRATSASEQDGETLIFDRPEGKLVPLSERIVTAFSGPTERGGETLRPIRWNGTATPLMTTVAMAKD